MFEFLRNFISSPDPVATKQNKKLNAYAREQSYEKEEKKFVGETKIIHVGKIFGKTIEK